MNTKAIMRVSIAALMVLAGSAYSNSSPEASSRASAISDMAPSDLSKLTDAEWRARLTSEQYAVLRQEGTEAPFTSDLLHETRSGTYVTADCGEPVFRSESKFDSGTGWPSFFQPIKGSVAEHTDFSLGIPRTEIVSAICHSHLGHVFNDAPQTPTGLRYCMNGVALVFVPDADYAK